MVAIKSAEERALSATQENAAFDGAMKSFLLKKGFANLDQFFARDAAPLVTLLKNDALADHLCRPAADVFFSPENGQPLLAAREKEIYALCRDKLNLDIHFRAAGVSNSGTGARVRDFFATTYSAGIHESLQCNLQTRIEQQHSDALPVTHQVEVNGVRRTLQEIALGLPPASAIRQHMVLFQARIDGESHGHIICAAVLFKAGASQPSRILFVDDNEEKSADTHDLFVEYAREHFPGMKPSQILDVSQNLHDMDEEKPVHQRDFNCVYYAHAAGVSLLHLAKTQSDLLLHGNTQQITHALTAEMTQDYPASGAGPAHPSTIERNLEKRWGSGQELLCRMRMQALEAAKKGAVLG